MDIAAIIGGVLAATGMGFGARLGSRALRIGFEARRDLRRLRPGRQAQAQAPGADLSWSEGRRRDSSIVGLYDNVLRHANGDISCAWEARLEPTMFSHDHTIEARCDGQARMLAVDKPPGTLVQFRFSSGPDPGAAILKHLQARGDGSLTHFEAARLHVSGLEFYQAAADAHRYRQSMLSVWARIPGKQKGDDATAGFNAFIPHAIEEIKRNGLASIPMVLRRSWAETADNGVVSRLIEDEMEAREKAEKVFRLVERECPLALRRLNRDRLWEAVYLGHRQDSQSVPILPSVFGLDIGSEYQRNRKPA
jgi:hypothetical protein